MSSVFGLIVFALGWVCVWVLAIFIWFWWIRALKGVPHDGPPTCLEDIVYDADGKCVSRQLIGFRRFMHFQPGRIVHLTK